jgi:hypothetical protein
MQEIKNDIWKELETNSYDAVCCTTNMIVKDNGELVMGAGIAKAFASKFSQLPKIWGEAALNIKKSRLKSNIIVTKWSDNLSLVSFPTKYDFKDKSNIELIESSVIQLYVVTIALGWKKVLLPRPGCNNGGLDWEKEVKPVLTEIFDDKIVIISQDKKE